MPPKLEPSPGDPTSAEKELTRKLYWSITSTLSLDRDQKRSTFGWVAELAVKIVARHGRPSPPASRPGSNNGRNVAMQRKDRYASLAGGGAAGRSDLATARELPSERVRPKPASQPAVTTAQLAAFTARQAAMRKKAIAYMVSENRRLGTPGRRGD